MCFLRDRLGSSVQCFLREMRESLAVNKNPHAVKSGRTRALATAPLDDGGLASGQPLGVCQGLVVPGPLGGCRMEVVFCKKRVEYVCLSDLERTRSACRRLPPEAMMTKESRTSERFARVVLSLRCYSRVLRGLGSSGSVEAFRNAHMFVSETRSAEHATTRLCTLTSDPHVVARASAETTPIGPTLRRAGVSVHSRRGGALLWLV